MLKVIYMPIHYSGLLKMLKICPRQPPIPCKYCEESDIGHDSNLLMCSECKEFKVACFRCMTAGQLRCVSCKKHYPTITLDYIV